MIELRISSAEAAAAVSLRAETVAAVLLELEEPASVAATWNVCRVAAEGPCALEPGVHAVLTECTRERFIATVWPRLQERFALTCGWVDASVPGFRGCTENYCRASACPHRLQATTL
jgi:hypothetical protein